MSADPMTTPPRWTPADDAKIARRLLSLIRVPGEEPSETPTVSYTEMDSLCNYVEQMEARAAAVLADARREPTLAWNLHPKRLQKIVGEVLAEWASAELTSASLEERIAERLAPFTVSRRDAAMASKPIAGSERESSGEIPQHDSRSVPAALPVSEAGPTSHADEPLLRQASALLREAEPSIKNMDLDWRMRSLADRIDMSVASSSAVAPRTQERGT